jgi:hypothetical protein
MIAQLLCHRHVTYNVEFGPLLSFYQSASFDYPLWRTMERPLYYARCCLSHFSSRLRRCVAIDRGTATAAKEITILARIISNGASGAECAESARNGVAADAERSNDHSPICGVSPCEVACPLDLSPGGWMKGNRCSFWLRHVLLWEHWFCFGSAGNIIGAHQAIFTTSIDRRYTV